MQKVFEMELIHEMSRNAAKLVPLRNLNSTLCEENALKLFRLTAVKLQSTQNL